MLIKISLEPEVILLKDRTLKYTQLTLHYRDVGSYVRNSCFRI